MAVKYIFCRFKPTRGLAQAIANRNPTLLDGECVFEVIPAGINAVTARQSGMICPMQTRTLPSRAA